MFGKSVPKKKNQIIETTIAREILKVTFLFLNLFYVTYNLYFPKKNKKSLPGLNNNLVATDE